MGSCGADNPIPKAESLSQCKSDDVVDAIKQAKSNDEINRIMVDARRRQE